MKNKIKELFIDRYGFSQIENNGDSCLNFHYIEDGHEWEVEVGVKGNEIRYIKFIDNGWLNVKFIDDFIDDGWINQPSVCPDDFAKFARIIDDWIWDMGIHPDHEWWGL